MKLPSVKPIRTRTIKDIQNQKRNYYQKADNILIDYMTTAEYVRAAGQFAFLPPYQHQHLYWYIGAK